MIDDEPWLGQEATALQLQTVLEARRNSSVQVGSSVRGVSKSGKITVNRRSVPLLEFYNTCASVVVEERDWDRVSCAHFMSDIS